MKNYMKIAAAIPLFIVPEVLNAAPPDGVYAGVVTISGDISLNCTLSLELSGSGTIVSNVAFGLASHFDLLCAAISFNSQPYGAAFSPMGFYAISGVDITFLTPPPCTGIILGTWSGNTIDINATVGGCTLSGSVSEVP